MDLNPCYIHPMMALLARAISFYGHRLGFENSSLSVQVDQLHLPDLTGETFQKWLRCLRSGVQVNKSINFPDLTGNTFQKWLRFLRSEVQVKEEHGEAASAAAVNNRGEFSSFLS